MSTRTNFRQSAARRSTRWRATAIAFGMLTLAMPSVTYSIVYPVNPVTIGNYSISGTIETDGTMGAITSANVDSWNVVVTGPFPHSFLDIAQNAFASGSLMATPTSLSTTGFFQLDDFDNSPGYCTSCQQALAWVDSSNEVVYGVADFADFSPGFVASLSVPGEPVFISGVPEPSSPTCIVTPFCWFAIRWRRARAKGGGGPDDHRIDNRFSGESK